MLVTPLNNPGFLLPLRPDGAVLDNAPMLANPINNPDFLLPLEPSEGVFNHEYSIRYALGPNAVIPQDEVGGVSIAQFFDPYHYLANNPEIEAEINTDDLSAVYDHFLTDGLAQGLDASSLFDEAFYLERNADVVAAIEGGEFSSGLDHFLRRGHIEGRDPNQFFKQRDYLLLNSDAATDIANGLYQSAFEHYVEEGADAGLWSDNSVVAPVFDKTYYLATYADVAESVNNGTLTAFEHFVSFGQHEAELRSPKAGFDLAEYAATPAVQADIAAGIADTSFMHYVQIGRYEA